MALDSGVARAYGPVFATVVARGRKARGPRVLDLLVAATALAMQLPLYTRNPDDLAGLDELVEIVAV